MTNVKLIHHIAIVVDDIDSALPFWTDALGLELSKIEEVSEQEAIVAFLPCGDSKVELVQPTTKDSGIAQFISKRGPGMHHICFEVDDIVNVMQDMVSKGVLMINKEPLLRSDGRKYAFIHPKSTGGVLVELYQLPASQGE